MAEVTKDGSVTSDIAVVGMAGRFPGALTPDSFWTNLRDGVESVRRLSDNDLHAAGVDPSTRSLPNYVKAAAVLDGIELFDAGFFGFSVRDAAILDPQHRQFLEVAWEALEDAGHVPERFAGSIGMFGGCGMNAYFMFNLLTNPALVKSVGLFLLRHTGNDKDFLTTRVSYCLNLTGPSIGVQTACSTSLVAVHTACQSLLSGECDMALAGGVTIDIPHGQGYLYQEGEILSPDGHCRAFDAESKGTLFGSGAGVVVLRRLADAIGDGDRIRAVIKGSAVNNDGSAKVGYLAPSVDGQAKAIREALSVAQVPARSVTYVETHGTGTPVGDPIEIAALTQAFRAETDARGFCAIGSVKTNIGHLDTAAGVASLIKVVLALEHRALPPSLNFQSPNPAIDFAATPFFVNAALKDWTVQGHPRRAGVSALGVGGTNAHVVVEEAPSALPSPTGKSRTLLLLSARSQSALDAATDRLADYVARTPDINLADVSFTLQQGRRGFTQRRAAVCGGTQDAVEVLRRRDPRRVVSRERAGTVPTVVFLFSGGGSQYPNMGRDLYREEPVYRAEVDRGLAWVQRNTGRDLAALMFPSPGNESAAARALEIASNSVLAIFITEYALARLWMSWGVSPAAMTGHSLGEYTAACLAGVFSFEDALAVVAIRGDIFDRLPAGAMLSVPLAEDALNRLLPPGVSLAAVNGPELCVVSGPVADIDAFAKTLAARDLEPRRLHIAVAAHSTMLEPFLDEFARRLSSIRMNAPTVPLISNRTGDWVQPADIVRPEYWVRHLRETVRFSRGLRTVHERTADAVFLEVGPGQVLTTLARLHLPAGAQQSALASMRHPDDSTSDLDALYLAAGRLWTFGLDLDWGAFHGEPRRRVSLPAYPFEHQPYWIAPGQVTMVDGASPKAEPSPRKIADPDAWFWQSAWRVSSRPVAAAGSARAGRVLAFVDDDPWASDVVMRLTVRGFDVVSVRAGDRFAQLESGGFSIRPGDLADMRALVCELQAAGRLPNRVLHMWLSRPPCADVDVSDPASTADARGFRCLLALAQALGAEAIDEPIGIDVVTGGLERVVPTDVVTWPERATSWGPVLVAPNELPNLRCRMIDLPPPVSPDALDWLALSESVIEELIADGRDPRVAFRDGKRWTEELQPVRVPPAEPDAWVLDGGVYLITGGLSGIGLEMATRMTRAARVTLLLLSRRGLPPRETWHALPASIDASTRRAVAAVLEMEALGSTVVPLAVDVTDASRLNDAIATARHQCGRIVGVLHAAGTVEDAPLQLKETESVRRVMGPKLQGVAALDAVLADDPPDWLVLFSSTSAFLGLPGQVDYTGANAFLAAFARARAGGSRPRTVAIQWGLWRDAGIAARAVGAELVPRRCEPARTASSEVVHPLLGHVVQRTEDLVIFEATYLVATHWILDEHRLGTGQALVPGTGFVEMARAAFEFVEGPGPMEIQDLFFMSSLEVGDADPRRVRVTMRRQDQRWIFSVAGETSYDWIEHARATVVRLATPPSGPVCIDALLASASKVVHFHDQGIDTRQERHLRFGPRWKTLNAVHYGTDSAVARVELPAAFSQDLTTWAAHPALLDMATAAGLPLVEGYDDHGDLYVPLSYTRIRIYGALPRALWSVVRLAEGHADSAEFDIALADDDGHVRLEADGFLMRRASTADVAARIVATRPGASPREGSSEARLAALVSEGITPDEGWAALGRVLQSPELSEVVVSSIDPSALRPKPTVSGRAASRSAPSARRTAESSLDEVERVIAEMWRDLLGVDDVGPDDDFFELGGHSLIAVRLIARMEKAFPKKLRLATLFEARTVRQLAEIVGERRAMSEWVSLVPIQTKGDKPPFFCVHGVGGEVLAYASLASRLAPNQPFVAFRAPGHDGKTEPLHSVEEQAAFYVKELLAYRPVGPYYIGGYSHGGRVALEMAQQLKTQGKQVAFLGIIDIPPCDLPKGRAIDAVRWLRNLPLWLWYDGTQTSLSGNVDRLRRGWRIFSRRAARGTSGPKQVEDTMNIAGMPESIQRIYQLDFAAFKAYRPRPYDGPITLFRSLGQPIFGRHDPDLGWRHATTGDVTIRRIPGNHLSILLEPEVGRLAKEVLAALEKAQAQS